MHWWNRPAYQTAQTSVAQPLMEPLESRELFSVGLLIAPAAAGGSRDGLIAIQASPTLVARFDGTLIITLRTGLNGLPANVFPGGVDQVAASLQITGEDTSGHVVGLLGADSIGTFTVAGRHNGKHLSLQLSNGATGRLGGRVTMHGRLISARLSMTSATERVRGLLSLTRQPSSSSFARNRPVGSVADFSDFGRGFSVIEGSGFGVNNSSGFGVSFGNITSVPGFPSTNGILGRGGSALF